MNPPKIASKQQKGIVKQYVTHFVLKNRFCYYLSPFSSLTENNCLNKSKFSSGFKHFKHDKKKISKYFSARF